MSSHFPSENKGGFTYEMSEMWKRNMSDYYGDDDHGQGFFCRKGLLRSDTVWSDRNPVRCMWKGQAGKQQGVLGMQPVRK